MTMMISLASRQLRYYVHVMSSFWVNGHVEEVAFPRALIIYSDVSFYVQNVSSSLIAVY